jgi:ribonuclease HI
VGGKAFRSWAPEAYNRTCAKVRSRGTQGTGEREGNAQTHRKATLPSDSDATERKGYYSYLNRKYSDRTGTQDEEGRTVIWTDGSSVETTAGVRKAGAGIFLGIGSKRNKELEVSGPQTNQRAELTALLHCLETEEGAIHIRTDSKYVELGVNLWRLRWRQKAWYSRTQKATEFDHADLWQRVDNLLEQRKPGQVRVSWVKGHALPRHIKQAMTTELDIWGNNQADELAGKASAMGTA